VAEAASDGILHGDSIRLRAVRGTSGRYRRKRMKTLFVRQELIPQMASETRGDSGREIQCHALVSGSGNVAIRCLARGV